MYMHTYTHICIHVFFITGAPSGRDEEGRGVLQGGEGPGEGPGDMCIYIYIYIYIYICIGIYLIMYIYIYILEHIYIYIYTHIYKRYRDEHTQSLQRPRRRPQPAGEELATGPPELSARGGYRHGSWLGSTRLVNVHLCACTSVAALRSVFFRSQGPCQQIPHGFKWNMLSALPLVARVTSSSAPHCIVVLCRPSSVDGLPSFGLRAFCGHSTPSEIKERVVSSASRFD